MQTFVYNFEEIGSLSDVAKVSVDATGAIAHTVTSGKRGVIFMNTGNGICWMGGSTVDPANSRGFLMLPRTAFQFNKVTRDFTAYFKCAATVTTTISVVEYD